MIDEEKHVDEAKRWKEILERPVTIQAAHKGGPVTMKLEQLLKWLWTKYGFCKSTAQVVLVSQWQRAHDHRDQERKQYAKNHYCGGNCESCVEYSCNVCSECPEWVRKIPWRNAWRPTPDFLPGESHGQRSFVAYGP